MSGNDTFICSSKSTHEEMQVSDKWTHLHIYSLNVYMAHNVIKFILFVSCYLVSINKIWKNLSFHLKGGSRVPVASVIFSILLFWEKFW